LSFAPVLLPERLENNRKIDRSFAPSASIYINKMQWISPRVRPVTVPAIFGVGAIPYSPATFFRTHFLRFILIAKSTANFNKLKKLTQWIDEKRLR